MGTASVRGHLARGAGRVHRAAALAAALVVGLAVYAPGASHAQPPAGTPTPAADEPAPAAAEPAASAENAEGARAESAGRGDESTGPGAGAGSPGREGPTTEVGGRVFARGELEREDGRRREAELSVESARVEVDHRNGGLRALVEVELSGRPQLKDAFVAVESGAFTLRAGQFKPPGPSVALASAWTLPVAERGLVHDLTVDRMLVGGRRPGVQGEWEGRGRSRPRARAGVFQGSDVEGDLLEGTGGQSAAARVTAEAGPAEVGAFAEWRAAAPIAGGPIERFWSAGVDLVADLEGPAGGIRAWLDVLAGSSWLHATGASADGRTFAAARLIAAWRRGGKKKGTWYVEPFVLLDALDPDVRVRSDVAWEVVGGLNVGLWRRVRATAQGGAVRVGRNASPLLRAADAETAILQIGAAF